MEMFLMAVSFAGISGLLAGLILGVAGKIFYVKTDERVEMIRNELPGNNCGGCGYAGCDDYASAIVEKSARPDMCTAGIEPENIENIKNILKGKNEDMLAEKARYEARTMREDQSMCEDQSKHEARTIPEKQVMYVKCGGNCDAAKSKYKCYGINSCEEALLLPNKGPKACKFGCLGYGSCVKVCENDAISIYKGLAVIDGDKCINCGKCRQICPAHVIHGRPFLKNFPEIVYSNTDKGKGVKEICSRGCIGCGICLKSCSTQCIILKDNLPEIDYGKCTACGLCLEKCPSKCIVDKNGLLTYNLRRANDI